MRLPAAPVRILIVAGLLAAGLVGTVVREGAARASGREVSLEIDGFDPRSVLSGHYVQFQFRSRFPAGTPCPPGADDLGSRAQWVALSPRGGAYAPSGAAPGRAEALKLGELAVRGRLTCIAPDPSLRTEVTTDLGLDRAHVDQAQAEQFERELRRFDDKAPPAYAVVSIGDDGKARLKGLSVGGRRFDLDWF